MNRDYNSQLLTPDVLDSARPTSVPKEGDRHWPRRSDYYPSSRDWHQETVYFLLPDRFSDEADRDLLEERAHPEQYRPGDNILEGWRWDLWAISGRNRFQGGTLKGVQKRLGYLKSLGVTVIWLGPVWKQRRSGVDVDSGRKVGDVVDDRFPSIQDGDKRQRLRELVHPRDDYHGYAIQDFLDVDPRFGTRADLCDLILKAHKEGMRVILDVVFNHCGVHFTYDTPALSTLWPPYPPPDVFGERYPFGAWLDADNKAMKGDPQGPDDGVWPRELQRVDVYSRKGFGDYGVPDYGEGSHEIRVADWMNRDIRYDGENPSEDPQLQIMIDIWSYWIALTDCDGFRIDTFKHVPRATARQFCREIRDFADGLQPNGKADFFLVGEVGGRDEEAATYINEAGGHLRALEVGERRMKLRQLAAGGTDPTLPSAVLTPSVPPLGKAVGDWVVTSIDDHDGLSLDRKQRMAARYGSDTVIPAAAFLLFGPGVPCIYYGTEQALAGPVGNESYLQDSYGMLRDGGGDPPQGGDRYLREAMFGPSHPRKPGEYTSLDDEMPGFGPMGTCGVHLFDETSPWYRAFQAMTHLRTKYPVLATGDIAICRIRQPGGSFTQAGGRLVAWSRTEGTRFALIVMNTDGQPAKSGSGESVVRPRSCDVLPPPTSSMAEGDVRLVARISPAASEQLDPPPPVLVDVSEQLNLPFIRTNGIEPRQILIYEGSLT